jgi:hypothetical protein
MKTFAGSSLAASVAFAALALASVPVQADTTSFDLNGANIAYPGDYASVTVNRTDSTHATITFQSLSQGGNLYDLGAQGAVAVNVNAASWSLSSINGSNSGTGFTPGPWSNGGAGNENGYGSFNQTIDSFDSYTHSSTTISFILTNTAGTWSSAGNVLTGNSQGNLAAAHILVCTVTVGGCDASGSALKTGYAAGNGGSSQPTEIPEPNSSSLAVLALCLLGAGFWTRRKA